MGIENNIVKLECGSKKGTALLINETHAITARHCVKDAYLKKAVIKLSFFHNGQLEDVYASPLIESGDEDALTILKLEDRVDFVSKVKFLDCSLKAYRKVRMFGYGKNYSDDGAWIDLDFIGRKEAISDSVCDLKLCIEKAKDSTFAGFSGSPVLNKRETFVKGIITHECQEEENKQAIYLEGISVRSQKEFFEKYEIPIQSSNILKRILNRKNKILLMKFSVLLIILFVSIVSVKLFCWINRDTSGLSQDYTTVEKLHISARFPDNWTVFDNEDEAYSTVNEDNKTKLIGFKMDYYWAPVKRSGIYTSLGSHSDEVAKNGAEDEYAIAKLDKYMKIDSGFFEKVEESAIYQINGRKYYYLQFEKDNEYYAFYFTVQDGAEIYFYLMQNDFISNADRTLFNNVLRSAKLETEGVNYSNLKASDFIKNIYKLNDDNISNSQIGITVNLPKVCEIKNEGEQIIAEYNGNSYSQRSLLPDQDPYKLIIDYADVSSIGSLDNGMNELIAESLLLQEEKEKGHVVTFHQYKEINGRNYFRITSKDVGGRYLSYMTMYRGKLLTISFLTKDTDYISPKAKNMVMRIIKKIEFDF